MTRHSHKKPHLSEAFGTELQTSEPLSPCYIQFYKAYVAAIEAIFLHKGAKVRSPVLSRVITIEDETLEVVFSTAHGFCTDPDTGTFMTEGVHRPSDRAFNWLFQAFIAYSQDHEEVSARSIYEGVYELEITDPVVALEMLEGFLSANKINGADAKPGEILGEAKKRDHRNIDKNATLACLPMRPFATAAQALDASRWIAATHNPCLFSMNYLRTLLHQAQNGRDAKLPDDLRPYSIQ